MSCHQHSTAVSSIQLILYITCNVSSDVCTTRKRCLLLLKYFARNMQHLHLHDAGQVKRWQAQQPLRVCSSGRI